MVLSGDSCDNCVQGDRRVPINGSRICDRCIAGERAKMTPLSFRNLRIQKVVLVFVILPCIRAADHGLESKAVGSIGVETSSESSIFDFIGEVRCYCNLPSCVSTGYMCKSSLGTCYSENIDHSDMSKSRHGCLELAVSPRPESCRRNQEEKEDLGEALYCCREDMCNYVDSLTRRQANETNSKHHLLKNAALEHLGVNVGVLTSLVNAQAPQHSRAEVWLKAATIAVPIAGGCILVLLIVLAVRMLKRDRRIVESLPQHKDPQNMFQKVLCTKRTEYALCPARLPRTELMVHKKFETNRRCQSLQSFGHPYHISPKQYNRACRQVDVTLAKDNFCDKSSLINTNLSPTVVVFGDGSPGRSRHLGMTV